MFVTIIFKWQEINEKKERHHLSFKILVPIFLMKKENHFQNFQCLVP